MTLVLNFNTDVSPDLHQVGGKAKALIETTQAGFPVPEGLVLSVSFFMEWIEEIKASAAWKTFLKDSTKENCEKLLTLSTNMLLTSLQKDELYKCLDHLSGNIFSVRSSSPEEDLEGSSFAGMYETYLGVTRDKLEHYITKAFSSCFDYRVMGYKKQNNISFDKTAIAIIIQRQIQSDSSGVAFSLNPLNNAYDEVVINASFGLGEAIVSGLVTPDTYIVDKSNNKIVDKKISKKEMGIWLTDSGGTMEKTIDLPEKPALSDNQIMRIHELVCQTEGHYKKPMDTEWAIENDQLYLLQARPITTHLPIFQEMMTKRGETKDLYMDFILVTQGFSDPMSDLGLDIWAKMVYKGNGLPTGKDGILWAIHGRHYMIMSHLMKVSSTMNTTFSSHDAPTKQIFAELNKKDFIQKKTPKKLKWFLWHTTKFMLSLYGTSTLKGLFKSRSSLEGYKLASKKVWNVLHKKLEGNQNNFEDQVNDALDGFSLLIKEIGGLLVAANLAKWKIERMFRKHKDASDLIVSLSMNLPDNPVSQMGRIMQQVASFPEFMIQGLQKNLP